MVVTTGKKQTKKQQQQKSSYRHFCQHLSSSVHGIVLVAEKLKRAQELKKEEKESPVLAFHVSLL